MLAYKVVENKVIKISPTHIPIQDPGHKLDELTKIDSNQSKLISFQVFFLKKLKQYCFEFFLKSNQSLIVLFPI